MSKKNKIIKSAGFSQNTEIGVMTPQMARDIAKIEDTGTATQRAAYEMMIIIDSILENDYNFSKDDFEHFHNKVKRMLATIDGLSVEYSFEVMNFEDMEVVGRMAERFLEKEKKERNTKLIEDTAKKLIEK